MSVLNGKRIKIILGRIIIKLMRCLLAKFEEGRHDLLSCFHAVIFMYTYCLCSRSRMSKKLNKSSKSHLNIIGNYKLLSFRST